MILSFSGHATAQAKIGVVGSLPIRLKSVYSGTVLKHDLKIFNSGNAPLDIINIAASCGCTTTELRKSHLGPGDTTSITITFDTQHFVGSTTKSFTIVSNDPVQRNLEVKIRSTIKSVLDMNPIPIYFGKAPIGQTKTITLGVKNLEKRALSILSVFDSSQYVTATPTTKTFSPSDSSDLQLAITPDQPGPFAGHLVFTTDSRKQPRIVIPYFFIAF